MGYMKQIDIEAQNIFEERAGHVLEIIEEEIQTLIDTEINRSFQQEAIFEGIRRLYHIYMTIQINFWVTTEQDIKNLKEYCKDLK